MRIAVVVVPAGDADKLREIAKAVMRGFEKQGHTVAFLDASLESDLRLLSYEFVAVGSERVSFAGKASPRVAKSLGAAGQLAGKRSFAFMPKSAFFNERACINLMTAMESQGMIVTDYAVFKNPDQALEFASSFRAERG